MGLLTGKTAIVTGAARGIGKAIALKFAAEGANIAFTDLVIDENGQNTEKEIAALGVKVKGYASNAASFEDTAKVVEQIRADFGSIDILVNNAGITKDGLMMRMSEQQWDAVIAVNLKSAFNFIHACTPIMMRQRSGSIINMASVVGVHGNAGQCNYAASKAGVVGLTKSQAIELAPYGIKVNAICPGNYLDGPLWSDPVRGLFVQYLNAGKVPGAKTVDDVRRYYESKVPLNRGCLPKDIARALFYIVEQEYETGQALPVTGGQEMLK